VFRCPRLTLCTVSNPLTLSTGRSQSRAIGEVVAQVALLSATALSPESPVRYGRHRQKIVIWFRSPSLVLLGLGLPLLFLLPRFHRLALYCLLSLAGTLLPLPPGLWSLMMVSSWDQSEVQAFNPCIHLSRPPRWLTTETQRSKKSASTMVLTILGKDAATKAISTGLSIFGRKFKVQKYLTFGPDTQCNKCLAFGHHTSKCTNNTYCNICAGKHPGYLHPCGHSDSPTKGKQCLHTTLKCSCGDPHQADFKECPTYLNAYQEVTERRKRADKVSLHVFPLLC